MARRKDSESVFQTRRSDKISKTEYREKEARLRVDLLNAQFDLEDSSSSLLILVFGDDRLSVEEIIDLIHEWLDARRLETEVFVDFRPEEKQRPTFWRYWRALPGMGTVGVFLGGWNYHTLTSRVLGLFGSKIFKKRLRQIRTLERMLVDDGTRLLKIWLHAPKGHLKRRLKKITKQSRSWSWVESDRLIYDNYKKLESFGAELVRETDGPDTRWTIIDGTEERSRNLQVMELLHDALQRCLEPRDPARSVTLPKVSAPARLSSVDMTASLDKSTYKKQLATLQATLRHHVARMYDQGRGMAVVFEGWDAGGKGGAIRRITCALPARYYRVFPIGAPNEEERRHPYLWRFWRRVPRAGRMVIFDRSWYGRVLVERVEGFASTQDWQRAYAEIRDFEEHLTEHGVVVCKFWMHIDQEEQLARFKARESTSFKKHKITGEDYRNRDRWDAYVTASEEMFARTDTDNAPWTVVPANDKRFARVRVLQELCDALDGRLET